MNCKDCDRPLTTYQGINQRPEDAEVFCAHCEANAPVAHSTHGNTFSMTLTGNRTLINPGGNSGRFKEMDPNEYVDFGTTGKSIGITVDPMYPWRGAPPCYLSLHSDDPGNPYAGNMELQHHGTGYARQPTTFTKPRFGVSFNEDAAGWVADKDWPRITHFGVWDSVLGGNLLFHSALTIAQDTEGGDAINFIPGAVTMQVT